MKFIQTLALLGGVSLFVACGDRPAETAPAARSAATNATPSAATNAQSYLVRGVVKKVDPEANRISIQHDEIPDYMAAMTMPFKVKDKAELEGLAPEDTIWFRLWVTEDESWIDRIKKDSTAAPAPPQAAAPERESVRIARDVPVLGVGDLLPDYPLTNQLGQKINLVDFRGQALAFTFIFTRCPIPEFCPRMSRNFQEVYQKLTAMPNAPTNWHLLSISFDPHFDTPSVLQGYSHAFPADPNRWSYATGAMIDIDALTDHFELAIAKRGNDWEHKLRTVVVDATGRIQQILYGNEWTPDFLVDEMVKAARVPPDSASPPLGR
jgi:protein SCO1/2